MKINVISYLLLAGMCLAISCSTGNGTRARDVFWHSAGTEADSVSALLDRVYIDETVAADGFRLTSEFDALRDTLPGARAQSFYWQARLQRRMGREDSAMVLVRRGMDAIDSLNYPYEWSRLVSIMASLNSIAVESAYLMSTSNMHYYEQIGDSLMLGSTLMRLGGLMWSISDTVPAARYYMRADTVFNRFGPEPYRIRNLLNLANIYDKPSSHTQRDSLMNVLLKSDAARRDSSFFHVVLRNQYYNTGDFRFLKQAYNYLAGNDNFVAERAAYQGAIADYFIGNEFPPDSVAKYALQSYSNIDLVESQYDKATIFNAMAFTAYCQGDYNSSLDFYRNYLDARLGLEHEHFSLQTSKMEHLSAFERRQHELNIRAEHTRIVWIASLLTVVLIIMALAFILYVKGQRARIRRREAELELQRSRNYLRTYALDIDEKNRLIGSIVNNVDSLRQNGRIGSAEASEITANVKRSLGNTIEKETFTELYQKLHPEFILRLKKDHPTLTESQLKHAAYIAMGMSPKQIAQALNIEYASVKRSRNRLRQRMGLSPSDSIEDTLRIYDS